MIARAQILLASALTAVAVAVVAGVLVVKNQGRAEPVAPGAAGAPPLGATQAADPTQAGRPTQTTAPADGDALARAARTRVFFGHQSVGANIIGAIPTVYAEAGRQAPQVVQLTTSTTLPSGASGWFGEAFIGQNGDPLGKIADFDSRVRGGLGAQVDVAFMKLCYIDINAGTDVEAVFARYRATMDALERDYPSVTFLHVTTPLTTEPGLKAQLKSKVKSLLGGSSNPMAADNAARERYNALMRKTYGGDHLFDLARYEATTPDGKVVRGEYDGQPYYALYDGYAADPGHPNPQASAAFASRLLDLVGRVGGK